MRAAMSVPMTLVFLDGHHLIFVRRIDLDLEVFGGQVFFEITNNLAGGGFAARVLAAEACGDLVQPHNDKAEEQTVHAAVLQRVLLAAGIEVVGDGPDVEQELRGIERESLPPLEREEDNALGGGGGEQNVPVSYTHLFFF